MGVSLKGNGPGEATKKAYGPKKRVTMPADEMIRMFQGGSCLREIGEAAGCTGELVRITMKAAGFRYRRNVHSQGAKKGVREGRKLYTSTPDELIGLVRRLGVCEAAKSLGYRGDSSLRVRIAELGIEDEVKGAIRARKADEDARRGERCCRCGTGEGLEDAKRFTGGKPRATKMCADCGRGENARRNGSPRAVAYSRDYYVSSVIAGRLHVDRAEVLGVLRGMRERRTSRNGA